MSLIECVQLLEENEFVLIRSSSHRIYANGVYRIAISHNTMVSAGVMRKVHQAIKRARSEKEVVYG